MTRTPSVFQWLPGAVVWPGLLWSILAAGCGGAPESERQAQRLFMRGDLLAAQEQLGQPDSESGQALAEKIQSALAQRAQVEEQLAGVLQLEPKLAKARLKEMLTDSRDSWTTDRVQRELSDLMDAAASHTTTRPRKEQVLNIPAKLEPTAAPKGTSLAEQAELKRISEFLTEYQPEEEPGPVSSPEEVEPRDQAPIQAALAVVEPEPVPDVSAELLEALERAEAEFVRCSVADLDQSVEALRALYESNDYFLRRALRARWTANTQALLDHPDFEPLRIVAETRLELGRRRAQALELIFDTNAYFYPYTPPDCPLEKAVTYGAVQHKVDSLVEKVRESWSSSASASVSQSLRDLIESLNWQMTNGALLGESLTLPAELPNWVFSLRGENDTVNVQTITLGPEDLEARRYDGEVLAFNRRWWAEGGQAGLGNKERASAFEQQQVQATNAYRRMFGLPVLAWNPLLQHAARDHSVYMARVKKLTHIQEGDPKRRTHFDRMARVGYDFGAGENCLHGTVTPQAAHEMWVGSSEHHRNLLRAPYTELGSARAGSYWTQNFGTGREFQVEIDSWQD